MEILVLIKRVPMVGGRIAIDETARAVDSRGLGFTISPHEECAVEEAVRIVEANGGSVTVLCLGPPEAVEQLRDTVAVGAGSLVLLETETPDWGPMATSDAIVAEIERIEVEKDVRFDLVLAGNEAADTGDYQVGVRIAHKLGRPVATGIKALEVLGASVAARRTYRGVEERFELAMPAVLSVKEGINLPRYPSLPGRIRAKKAPVLTNSPHFHSEGAAMRRLAVPVADRRSAEVLGHGAAAVPALVAVLESIGVLS
ncbi:MAG: electron transfer flavoprotein subunit beta/FixA family protein [Acidimicrobiales bacterium]